MFHAVTTVLVLLHTVCGEVSSSGGSDTATEILDPYESMWDKASGKQCHSSLDLPPGYNLHKPPSNPMDIAVEFEIRQVRQVHEETLSYDLHLQLMLTWTDERLIGQTEKAGCNPVFVHEGKKLWVPGTTFCCKIEMRKRFTIILLSDVHMESMGNINYFSNMLHNDAGFLIDETGQIMAYMSVAVNNYCKHMSFAAYPKDKHKCEFFISSLSYLEACR